MEMAVAEIVTWIKQDLDVLNDELQHYRATEAPDYVIEQCKGRITALTQLRDRIFFTYADFDGE